MAIGLGYFAAMRNDALARKLVEFIRQGDEASAYNVADSVVAGDREVAVVTLLQLAAWSAETGEPGEGSEQRAASITTPRSPEPPAQ